MKIFVLSIFLITLIGASEVQQAVPDVLPNESRMPEANYEGAPTRGGLGHDVYSERLDDKERNRYPEQILNNGEKNPMMEEILFGYGAEKGHVGKEHIPRLFLDDHPEGHGHHDSQGHHVEGYKIGFPDYKYRNYGREGLGFDKRTAYALGLRYPLTPMILQTLYRQHNLEDKQNVLGKIVQA